MKLIVSVLGCFLLLSFQIFATTAPYFVQSNANGSGAVSSYDLPFTNTVGKLTNGILVVGLQVRNASAQTPTTIQYAGTNLTQAVTTNNGGLYYNMEYYVLNPATGSNNIHIVWSTTIGLFSVTGSSYEGVAQSSQPDSTAANSFGSITVPVLTNTTATANCMIVDSYEKVNNTGTVTPGTAQTTIVNSAINSTLWTAATYQPTTTTGNYISTYTNSVAASNLIVMVAYKPVADAVTSSPDQTSSDLRLMGVGH